MAKGPAVVFITRHGARLDQADKQWHLTSPTPYDSPLSYGGWTQAKALGRRIAALLHERQQESGGSACDGHNGDQRPHLDPLPSQRRRYRIVLHTSPYLRCLQTSTGIAAGIAQHQPPLNSAVCSSGPPKVLLRVDAFLGEWLCPDYFEDITSPPPSALMVQGARSWLTSRGDSIETPHGARASQSHLGLWGTSSSSTTGANQSTTQDGSFPTLGALAQALPQRDRSSSQGNAAPSRSMPRGSALETDGPSNVYNPPLPAYAVGPAEPIPRGYTAHARDACLNVDHQWDSSRPPMDWGDAGEYDEEWSAMHKRFRKGLSAMMAWYKEHGVQDVGNKCPPLSYHPGTLNSSDTLSPATEEDDEELILILVTHGAGCHAMLTAIGRTNQELLNVDPASVSMAVRRDLPRLPSSSSLASLRSPVPELEIAHEYDIKIRNNSDHLRDPSQRLSPPPIAKRPSVDTRRIDKEAERSTITQWLPGGGAPKPTNSSLGSMRRTPSSGSGPSRFVSHNIGPVTPSAGLWSNTTTPLAEDAPNGGRSPGYDMFPNFNFAPATSTSTSATKHTSNGSADAASNNTNDKSGNDSQKATSTADMGEDDHEKNEDSDKVAPLPQDSRKSSVQSSSHSPQGQQGLWGPPRLDDLVERDKEHKRRWTMTGRE